MGLFKIFLRQAASRSSCHTSPRSCRGSRSRWAGHRMGRAAGIAVAMIFVLVLPHEAPPLGGATCGKTSLATCSASLVPATHGALPSPGSEGSTREDSPPFAARRPLLQRRTRGPRRTDARGCSCGSQSARRTRRCPSSPSPQPRPSVFGVCTRSATGQSRVVLSR